MNISAISSTSQYNSFSLFTQNSQSSETGATGASQDLLSLGANGQLSTEDTIRIVNERALSKLRSVVDDAKAELGISADSPLDTSAEATGNRIADFALGAFDKWLKNHKLEDNAESRQQFADFIGAAINEGISQASEILGALQALTPENQDLIQNITAQIQSRFDAFLSATSDSTDKAE
jgi:hypothetical protein